MSWKQVFCVVTGCALAGMLLGGAFGWLSGRITPDFFRHLIPWKDVEPVGLAIFLGATAGVLLGGGLGCFAIIVQSLLLVRRRSDAPSALPSNQTA